MSNKTIPLKTVRRTQRHNFDTAYIQKLLENDTLTREDATRILGEALHVVCALRVFVRDNARYARGHAEDTGMQALSQWMGPSKR